MIGTRVLVGSFLALAAVGVLIGDGYLAPWFPCLFICLMSAGVLASRELVLIFPESFRPSRILVTTAILLCVAGNWYPRARNELGFEPGSVWPFLVFVFIATLISAFLLKCMATANQAPSSRDSEQLCLRSLTRALSCFFVQIRLLRFIQG